MKNSFIRLMDEFDFGIWNLINFNLIPWNTSWKFECEAMDQIHRNGKVKREKALNNCEDFVFVKMKFSERRRRRRWRKSILCCYAQFVGIHQQSHAKWQSFFMIKTLQSIRSFWKDVKKMFKKQKLLVKIEKYEILLENTKKDRSGWEIEWEKERKWLDDYENAISWWWSTKTKRYQANIISKWLVFVFSHPQHRHQKRKVVLLQ